MNVWVFGSGCQRWSVTLRCSNGLESPVRFRALSEFQTGGFCAERANGIFHNVRSNVTASCLSNQTSAFTKKPRLKPQRNTGRKFSLSSFSGQGMLKNTGWKRSLQMLFALNLAFCIWRFRFRYILGIGLPKNMLLRPKVLSPRPGTKSLCQIDTNLSKIHLK